MPVAILDLPLNKLDFVYVKSLCNLEFLKPILQQT